MFKNPGKKIKIVGNVCWVLSIIAGFLVLAALEFDVELFDSTLLGGVCVQLAFMLEGWIVSLIIYGIGEAIESLSNIRENVAEIKNKYGKEESDEIEFANFTKTAKPKTDTTKKENDFKEQTSEETEGWDCPCCGEHHEISESICKCGFILNDK